jgi:ureidoacrylate peracid hydrolase
MATADGFDQFSSKQAEGARREISPQRTAVLVVDMVNDYLLPEGAMPLADSSGVIAGNLRLVALAREAGALVVWIRPGHNELADGLFRKRIPHAIGESEGAQIHSALEALPDERILRKRRYSAFFQTDLDLYLREHDIQRVVVSGVALNICVRSTVHDAFFNNYDVWVPPEAAEATGPREAESTLYDISTHFGEVIGLDDIQLQWLGR